MRPTFALLLLSPLHAALLAIHHPLLRRPAAAPRAAAAPAAVGPVQGKGDVLMVPFFQPIELGATPMLDSTLTGLDAALGGALSQLLCTSEFTGALGSSATTALPAAAPFAKCAAIGLGKPTGFRSLGAMYVTWGELIARFTRRERYEVAVAVLPRIDGGLDESLGFDERGMVIAAGPGRSLPQAVGPPPEPLSLPPAKPSPLEALGRVASMFAPSGSSAAGPSAAERHTRHVLRDELLR